MCYYASKGKKQKCGIILSYISYNNLLVDYNLTAIHITEHNFLITTGSTTNVSATTHKWMPDVSRLNTKLVTHATPVFVARTGACCPVEQIYLYSTSFTGCLSVTRNLRTCGQMAFDSRPWKSCKMFFCLVKSSVIFSQKHSLMSPIFYTNCTVTTMTANYHSTDYLHIHTQHRCKHCGDRHTENKSLSTFDTMGTSTYWYSNLMNFPAIYLDC